MNNRDRILSVKTLYQKKEEKYIQALGRQEQILKLISSTENKIKEIDTVIDQLTKVDSLFKITSDYARQQSKEQIENIVSNCL